MQVKRGHTGTGAKPLEPRDSPASLNGTASVAPLSSGLSARSDYSGASVPTTRAEASDPNATFPPAKLGWEAHPSAGGALSRATYVPGAQVTVRRPAKHGGGTREVPAKLLGHDSLGRAVVIPVGGNAPVRVEFSQLTLQPGQPMAQPGLEGAREVLLTGIDPKNVHPLDPRVAEVFKRSLQQKLVGNHTAQEFVDALQRRGHAVMMVGGAVRDLQKELARNPGATVEELMSKFKDLDVVTTAGVDEIHAAVGDVVKEPGLHPTWTTEHQDRFGIVGIGQRKSGMDICSLKARVAPGEELVFGKTIAADVKFRDFTVNQLYVELGSQQLIDPTGKGLDDVAANRLVFNQEALSSNNMMSLRFLKFRARGFGASKETIQQFREHVSAFVPHPMIRPQDWANLFLRILPGDVADAEGLDRYLGQLKTVMQQDDLPRYFEEYVSEGRSAVLAELRARAGVDRG